LTESRVVYGPNWYSCLKVSFQYKILWFYNFRKYNYLFVSLTLDKTSISNHLDNADAEILMTSIFTAN